MEDFFSNFIGVTLRFGPVLLVILLALLLPTIVVIVNRVTKNWPEHTKLAIIFSTIILGMTLQIAFSERVIHSVAEISANPRLELLSQIEGNPWFSRFAHLILLTISIGEIFLWFTQQRKMGQVQFNVWCAAMIYFTLSVPVSALLGHPPEFNLNLIYAPIVFTAVALLASTDYEKCLRVVRWALIVPLIGSLLAMLIQPDLVLETGYKGLIPNLDIRLAGLTPHANSLGIMACVSLFIEISQFVRKKPNIFFVIVICANLLLSQSKTAWVMAIVGIIITSIFLIANSTKEYKKSDLLITLVAGGLFLSSLVFLYIFFKIDALQSFIENDKTGLMTLTGRTRIWEITLNEFFKNPISGYGPAIWDISYRTEKGMLFVGQAHNQYIHILGQAGLIGILSLLFYIFQLLQNSIRGLKTTLGLGFLFVLILLVRGLTETPMMMIGILDINNLIHLLAFALVISTQLESKKKKYN